MAQVRGGGDVTSALAIPALQNIPSAGIVPRYSAQAL